MRAVVTCLMGAKGRIFGTRANELSKIPYFRGGYALVGRTPP